MRLLAVIQFYLPYVLPRAPNWEGAGVTAEIDALVVKVVPRWETDPLFPNEIDQTLSSMRVDLLRSPSPAHKTTYSVGNLVHDRIQAMTEGEIDSRRGEFDEAEERFKSASVRLINTFLEHCRVVAGVPFMRGVEERFRLPDGHRYIINPHSITWFEAATENPYPFYAGKVNATASSGAIATPERGTVSMQAILNSLNMSTSPSLPLALIIDATEQLITLRLREAVLSLSTACEVASNQYLTAKGKARDPEVARCLSSPISFAEKRFHLVPMVVSGVSLRESDPSAYQLIETLYRARNSVTHEGRAEFADGPKKVTVDLPLGTHFLNAAKAGVEWLMAL